MPIRPTCTWCKEKISDIEWQLEQFAIIDNRYFHDHNKPQLGVTCKESWIQLVTQGGGNAAVQSVPERD